MAGGQVPGAPALQSEWAQISFAVGENHNRKRKDVRRNGFVPALHTAHGTDYWDAFTSITQMAIGSARGDA